MAGDLIRLERIGFLRAGGWTLKDENLAFELSLMAGATHLLYAFVVGDDVKSVGKTTRTLKRRMRGYRKPSKTQRTNLRIHREIKRLLESGHTVDIFVLTNESPLQIGEFRVNLAASLEDDIIEKLDPEWNGG